MLTGIKYLKYIKCLCWSNKVEKRDVMETLSMTMSNGASLNVPWNFLLQMQIFSGKETIQKEGTNVKLKSKRVKSCVGSFEFHSRQGYF